MQGRPDPDPNARDYEIPCPDESCYAEVHEQCKGLRPGVVHLGRRIKALALERLPELLEPMS